MRIALTYAIFAFIATAANIAAQELAVWLHEGRHALPVAMIAGTAVGLVVKYVLDKRYIFNFRARDAAHDGRTFALYTAMGLATTLVFWAFEVAFDFFFQTREMRYVGAVIGLAIGYFAKYRLDRRFVFRAEPA